MRPPGWCPGHDAASLDPDGNGPAYRLSDVARRRGPLRELTQDRESAPPAAERPRNDP